MEVYDEKKVKRMMKSWHHDIKRIDGKWVEDVVGEFQNTPDSPEKDVILAKIIENYAIFRPEWAHQFSLFLDGDIEAGSIMHDEIVWTCAKGFKTALVKKANGCAFNAYLVSGLLNNLKNMRNKKMSHKNHPRMTCPICSEKVYQIDEKHLRHEIDIEMYQKMFPGYPIVSLDGLVPPPWGGQGVHEITESLLNRSGDYLALFNGACGKAVGFYTMDDFAIEFPHLVGKRTALCPMTKMMVRSVDRTYPASLMDGYTEDEFLSDFPDFDGAITCPISGDRLLEMTQDHLNKVLKQTGASRRVTMDEFKKKFKFFTMRTKQVPVMNPYTGKTVREITHDMLYSAGTNVRDHLSRYATITVGKRYDDPFPCPFTGKKMYSITKEYLDKIGKTVHEFYQVACKYPFRRWQVRSAIDGTWVDNIWSYLSETKQRYASEMSICEFERTYGRTTKAFVSTNSYFESDSGDSAHVADLLVLRKSDRSAIEMEDSLLSVAQDDMDKKIVAAVRDAHTLEDLFFTAAEMSKVKLDTPFQYGMTKAIRAEIKDKTGYVDFDISTPPKPGAHEVVVMVPSRDTLRRRLVRMVGASDIDK